MDVENVAVSLVTENSDIPWAMTDNLTDQDGRALSVMVMVNGWVVEIAPNPDGTVSITGPTRQEELLGNA